VTFYDRNQLLLRSSHMHTVTSATFSTFSTPALSVARPELLPCWVIRIMPPVTASVSERRLMVCEELFQRRWRSANCRC